MKIPLARRAAVTLIAVLALAFPSLAAAEAPSTGHYRGAEGVSFVVGHTEHGSPVVESTGYHGHTGFERAPVHSGTPRGR